MAGTMPGPGIMAVKMTAFTGGKKYKTIVLLHFSIQLLWRCSYISVLRSSEMSLFSEVN